MPTYTSLYNTSSFSGDYIDVDLTDSQQIHQAITEKLS
jgi:hypothetical protein